MCCTCLAAVATVLCWNASCHVQGLHAPKHIRTACTLLRPRMSLRIPCNEVCLCSAKKSLGDHPISICASFLPRCIQNAFKARSCVSGTFCLQIKLHPSHRYAPRHPAACSPAMRLRLLQEAAVVAEPSPARQTGRATLCLALATATFDFYWPSIAECSDKLRHFFITYFGKRQLV